MKKLFIVLIISLMLFSCSKKKEDDSSIVKYPYEIKSKQVDMSAYEGVSSTNHNFKKITVDELFNTIDKKSSGIFYLGRSNCGCCQRVTKYMSQAAMQAGVTIYYIDVYDEEQPLTNQAIQDKLLKYMYDIANTDDNNEKVLLTPHVFSVVNGEFYGSQVCYDGMELDPSPSEKQVKTLINAYLKIFEPFISK